MWMRIFGPGRVLLGGKKGDQWQRFTGPLLLEHLLQVADFTLHLPASFFCRPVIAQVWVPCCVARLFFHFAFRFPKSTLDFILCARFHKNKIAHYELSGCEKLASFSLRSF